METNSEQNKSVRTKIAVNNNKAPFYVFDTLKTVIFVFAITIITFTFFIRDVTIDGPSMMNTLLDRDKVILTNFCYEPKAGDIVAINAEDKLEKVIIKRVIAAEGQTLKIDYSTGEVCVDGIILDEKYISSPTNEPEYNWDVPYIIPDGYVFVMGDNRSLSLDSRSEKVQLIPIGEIIGKAQFIVYPFDRFSYLY